MNYMQELNAWLNETLKHLPNDYLDEAKKAIKAKIYQSYKNGVESAKRLENELERQDKQWKRAKSKGA